MLKQRIHADSLKFYNEYQKKSIKKTATLSKSATVSKIESRLIRNDVKDIAQKELSKSKNNQRTQSIGTQPKISYTYSINKEIQANYTESRTYTSKSKPRSKSKSTRERRKAAPVYINNAQVDYGVYGVTAEGSSIPTYYQPEPTYCPPEPDCPPPEPVIKSKKTKSRKEYKKEYKPSPPKRTITVNYNQPPAIQPPGDVIVNIETDYQPEAAPPVVIRQTIAKPESPLPFIIREAPPVPPSTENKYITIAGKKLEPPERKVLIEKIPQFSQHPQKVIIERWLPYEKKDRKVILEKSEKSETPLPDPNNLIIQWESDGEPKVTTVVELKYLGVIDEDPIDYFQKFSPNLFDSKDLPDYIKEIKSPEGIFLASESPQQSCHKLYGDLDALMGLDLEKEGLGEYSAQINGLIAHINIMQQL